MSDFAVSEQRAAARVEILSARNPISLQANAARKASLKADLATAVAKATTGVFTGDVEVTIEWFVSPKVRYGTHMIADLDNIVKPLLDAVTGPDGVLIDDNQVQSLRVSWLDPVDSSTRFRLTLESISPDEYAPRKGLFFVEFSPDRCFPIFAGKSQRVACQIVRTVNTLLQERQQLISSGVVERDADYLLPVQRFFPKSRLGRFIVRPSIEFLTSNQDPGSKPVLRPDRPNSK